MNIGKQAEFDAIIQACIEAVDEVLNGRRCPQCRALSLAVLDKGKPTGIFNCVNAACSVRTYDPTFPEGL